jgi:hypothetical protein
VPGLSAFLPALAAVAAPDTLLTLPARLGARFPPGFGLLAAPPNLAVRSFPVSAFLNRRNAADPRSTWLIGQRFALVP